MDAAYQQIWDADQSQNGVPAVRPGEPRDDAVGFVIVDERATSVGRDHRVLKEVVVPDSKAATYDLCVKLLDNYALERAASEFIRPEEIQEELDFVDAILPTGPMQAARQVLEQRLGLAISNDSLAAMVKETWFKLGTAGSQSQASGFEHVFVGEQGRQQTKIGGYHYWHKYFLDDGGAGTDRIEYKGTQYQDAIESDKGILVPEVVTLSLVWEAPIGDRRGNGGSGTKTLKKPIGGFFVGCSPECLIAMGLVRCRTMGGKLAKINGAEYQLDLHRLDSEPNSIRTFFPRFRRADITSISGGGDDGPSSGSGNDTDTLNPQSPFKLVAAMVNPVNPEGGREFVQILNKTATPKSLKGWRLVAPNGTSFTFADIDVQPAEVFKFVIPQSSGVLRNRAGRIRLFNDESELQQLVSYSTEQARNEGEPVVFS